MFASGSARNFLLKNRHVSEGREHELQTPSTMGKDMLTPGREVAKGKIVKPLMDSDKDGYQNP